MSMFPMIKIQIMTLVFVLADQAHSITVGCGGTFSSTCSAGNDLWFRRVASETRWFSVPSMHIVSFEPAVPPFPCCSQVTVVDEFNLKCTVIIPPNIVNGVFTPRLIFPDFNNFLTSPLTFARVQLQYSLSPAQPVADVPQSILITDTFNAYTFAAGDAFTLRAGTGCSSTQLIGSYVFPGPASALVRAEFIPAAPAARVVICYFRSSLSCGTAAEQQPILVANATFEIFDRIAFTTSPSSPFLRGFPLRIALACANRAFNTFSSTDLVTIRKQSCVNIMIQTRSGGYDGSSVSQRILTVVPDEEGTGFVVCLQRGTSLPVQIGQGQTIDVTSLRYSFTNSASGRVPVGLPTTLTVTADRFAQFTTTDVVTLQKDNCAATALTVTRSPSSDLSQLPTTISVLYYLGEAYTNAVVCVTRKASFVGLTTDPVVQVGVAFQAVSLTYTTSPAPVQDFPFTITLLGFIPFTGADTVVFKAGACNASQEEGVVVRAAQLLENTLSMGAVLQETYPALAVCLKRGSAVMAQIGATINVGRISYTVIPAQLSLAAPLQVIVGPAGVATTDLVSVRLGSCTGESAVVCPNGSSLDQCTADSAGRRLLTVIASRVTQNAVVCVLRGGTQAIVYPAQNTSQFLSIGGRITYMVDPAEPLSGFPFTVNLYGVATFDNNDAITLRRNCCASTCALFNTASSQIAGTGLNRTLLATATESAQGIVVCLSRAGLPQVLVSRDSGVSGFNIVGITATFSRQPARGIAVTIQLTGTAQWGSDDRLFLGKDDCTQALALAPAGVVYGAQGGTLTATLVPAEAYTAAVLCLVRGGNPGVRIGAAFAVASLTYALLPLQASQNMQLRVQLAGLTDFNANDIITVRKESCAGDSIRSPYTPILSGAGGSRFAVFTPTEEYNRCVVCLSRDSGANRVQVGSLFSIASPIQYSLFPSQPTVGVCVRIALTGVQDFSDRDTLTLKRGGGCDGADIRLSNDPACSVTNTQRVCEFMTSEVVSGASVCLSRSGLVATQIGSTFDIRGSVTYTIDPAADIIVGMPFSITLSGVTDFGNTDVVSLRKDSCSGDVMRSMAPISVNGTGASRRVSATPIERSSVAVCLQRSPCSGSVKVGANFAVGNIDITLIPARPLRGMDFQCSLTGSTTFKDTDAITFRKDSCDGARINGEVTLFGSGTSRMAAGSPSEAYPNVIVCYTRAPGFTSAVGAPFAIANIMRKLTPDTPTRSNLFTVSLFGDQNFDDFRSDDSVAVRAGNCSGVDVPTTGMPILSNTVNMRSLSLTPRQSCTGCVTCFKRASGGWLRVGDPFDIVEPFPSIVSYQCSSLYTSSSNPPVLCKNGDTLTMQGSNFDSFGDTSIRFVGGTGPPPVCGSLIVPSAGALSCTLQLQPGSGGQWGFRVSVNGKSCCSSSPSCTCGVLQPYPSLSAVRGCGGQQSSSIIGCSGGTLLSIMGAQFVPGSDGNAVAFQCAASSQCSGTPPTCGPRTGPSAFSVVDANTALCPLTIWADTKGLWAMQVVIGGLTVPYNSFSLMAAQKSAPRVTSIVGCASDGATNRGCVVGSTLIVRGSEFDQYTVGNNQIILQCCPTCGVICVGVPICTVVAATPDTVACILSLRSLSVNGRWSLSANVAGTMSTSSVSIEVARCGDAELTTNEQCDDGNANVGDGCSMTCQIEDGWNCPAKRICTPICGDGERLYLEECDDGNTLNGDGCSAKCLVESPTYLCNSPLNKTSACVRCGDSVVQAGEDCDDGNSVSGDGCSALCEVEAGWRCADRKACTSICGDGVRTNAEQCDDRNTVGGDGCSAKCEVEPYYSCAGNVGERSTCQQVSRCGDGARAADEACDDGNTVNADGCGTNCQVEVGWTCSSQLGATSQCAPVCGDGLRFPPEECDDGNQLPGDGCSPRCVVEAAFYCDGLMGKTSACTTRPICGDGSVKAPEQCDDGGVLSGDGCSPSCVIEPGWVCSLSGARSVCLPICGDGIRQPIEACDDGDRRNSDGCNTRCAIEPDYVCEGAPFSVSKCKFVGRCGDGLLNEGEFCDDGNTASSDGCSPACAIETGWQCNTLPQSQSVCMAVCGDNVRIGAEQCDDGNRVGGDGCSAVCEVERGFSCSGALGQRSICSQALVCGDRRLGETEQCDDGNQVSGDGCSPSCVIETGWNCTSALSGVSQCSPICGDSVRMPNELCDDGNLVNGDGCSSNCTIELGFYCGGKIGSWSTCTLPALCGDGSRHASESCDDGNIINGDGCDSGCRVEPRWSCSGPVGRASACSAVCGDGFRLAVEECDDGDTSGGDGCSAFCRAEVGFQCTGGVGEKSVCIAGTLCGNSVRTPDEDCDDGNLSPGDGCTASCKVEAGWLCPTMEARSTCSPICGDGRRLVGEDCDDGNTRNGDGCSSTCLIEDAFQCSGSLSARSTCTRGTQCGDGIRTSSEECDDGNTNSGDGCSPSCSIEVGYACTNTMSVLSVCYTVCGDGYRGVNEQCDDGNLQGRDGCSASCIVEPGWKCITLDKKSVCSTKCGDGIVAAIEKCDDGNLVPKDGCTEFCDVEAGFSCTAIPGLVSVCSSVCGDGMRGVSESCDDFNLQNGDGCNALCSIEQGWSCIGEAGRTSVCSKVNSCGDGIRTVDEACDDGNTRSGDGCSPVCLIESGFRCTTIHGMTSECDPLCGDGIRFYNEECDDGNQTSGDGCSLDCSIEQGFECSGTFFHSSRCYKACGDGRRSTDEQCDDGNTVDNDGCSAQCKVEFPLFDCLGGLGALSRCTRQFCGDGKLSSSEECDDRNQLNGDGCDSTCRVEKLFICDGSLGGRSICVIPKRCGDAKRHRDEQCDDGNFVSGDGCGACFLEVGWSCTSVEGDQSTCTAVCGDGLRQLSEDCDDGNRTPGDGCSDTCALEPGYMCLAPVGKASLCAKMLDSLNNVVAMPLIAPSPAPSGSNPALTIVLPIVLALLLLFCVIGCAAYWCKFKGQVRYFTGPGFRFAGETSSIPIVRTLPASPSILKTPVSGYASISPPLPQHESTLTRSVPELSWTR